MFISNFSLIIKYTVTPASEAMTRNATIIMAAILGVLRLCMEAVEAVETSEEAEDTEGVGSLRCPISEDFLHMMAFVAQLRTVGQKIFT